VQHEDNNFCLWKFDKGLPDGGEQNMKEGFLSIYDNVAEVLSWQIITDFLILKKENVYDVEKMRIIKLLCAEFNMNNKKM
jgi:hypothetical protein